MLARLERKLAEIQTLVDSTLGPADWPAAIALALRRTRPSRSARPIWVRPARLNGLRIRLDPGDLSQFVIYDEVFVQGVYDLDRLSFVPDDVVDCGAYAGYFSLLARAKYPAARITAFEPNADNYETLMVNSRDNQLAIDAHPEAVSTRDGTARFSGAGCGGHLDNAAADAAVVTLVDLRRVVSGLHSERLLLKMDIEGEEAALLPALLPILPRRCAIFLEWHHGSEAFDVISRQMQAYGFATTVTRTHQIDGTTFIDAFAQRT